MNKINYLGFSILDEKYRDFRKSFSAGSVVTISPNSYGLSVKDKLFKSALNHADILVLDGVYFGLGYFLKTGKRIEKNQAPEIFYDELAIQNKNSGRVLFFGSTIKTLSKIEKRLYLDYPNLIVSTISPPFKDTLDESDNLDIEREINAFKPDVIFVGMTCPKQEIWIHNQKHKYPGVLFLAIGGVFDWFAGNYKELHPLWWKLRLGWLGRAIQRPELLKRNIPNYWIYFKDMLKS